MIAHFTSGTVGRRLIPWRGDLCEGDGTVEAK
jgi:hypothetical protein